MLPPRWLLGATAAVPGLAPAGDSLSWAPKKVSKETAPGYAALPAVGFPAMLGT